MPCSLEYNEQLQNIFAAIKSSGWEIKVESSDVTRMPVDIIVAKDELTLRIRIYTWAIVKSGREGERKINWRYLPTRIAHQASGDALRIELRRKAYNLLVGQSDELGVLLFALFDPYIHREHLESSPVQIRLETLQEAKTKGFAQQPKNTGDITIVFRAEDLMQVVQGLYDVVFKQKNKNAVAEKISEIAASEAPVNQDDDVFTGLTPRERAAALRAIRDPGFRNRVLQAYEHRCAVCGIDLDFVIAAHIVSVGQGGSDETKNGIVLCPNHHGAFDMGFIAFSENYEVVVNRKELKSLIDQGKKESVKAFLDSVGDRIRLPRKQNLHPPPEYLRRALEERGMTDCVCRSSLSLEKP